MLTEADKKYLTRLLNNINGSIQGQIYELSINRFATQYYKDEKTVEHMENMQSRRELIERLNND